MLKQSGARKAGPKHHQSAQWKIIVAGLIVLSFLVAGGFVYVIHTGKNDQTVELAKPPPTSDIDVSDNNETPQGGLNNNVEDIQSTGGESEKSESAGGVESVDTIEIDSSSSLSETVNADDQGIESTGTGSFSPDSATVFEKSEAVQQESEDDAEALGDLSIAGRILNNDGDPIPGIAVTVQPIASQTRLGNDRVLSDHTGSYKIQGLFAGEYRLSTTATDVYPSAVIIVRAGLQSADIVLVAGYKKTVFGTVTDNASVPLPGVEVSLSQPNASIRTDDDGRYELTFTAQGNRRYSFKYKLAGYSEKTELLPVQDFATERTQMDVQLVNLGNTVGVTGTVRSELGDAIQGARVDLASGSLGTRYAGTSDGQGNFSILSVKPGTDYQLSVQTRQLYERFWKKPVTISSDSNTFEITLKPLVAGQVSGSMVDVYGNGIPNFSLVIRSSRMPNLNKKAIGDELGLFSVDEVPEGDLTFSTQSNPYLSVSGLSLEQGQDVFATLVLDWGNHRLAGQVVDDRSNPVKGARVSLTWSSTEGGLKNSSSRSAISDANGLFRFTEVGPGVHHLDIEVPGYKRAKQDYNVGTDFGDVVISLESK